MGQRVPKSQGLSVRLIRPGHGEAAGNPSDPWDPWTGLKIAGRLMSVRGDRERGPTGNFEDVEGMLAALAGIGRLFYELDEAHTIAWNGKMYRGRPVRERMDETVDWFGPPTLDDRKPGRFHGFRQPAWYVASSRDAACQEIWKNGAPSASVGTRPFHISGDGLLDLRPKRPNLPALDNIRVDASRPRIGNTEALVLRLVRDYAAGLGAKGVLYPSVAAMPEAIKAGDDSPFCIAIWDTDLVKKSLSMPAGDAVQHRPQ